MAAGDFTRTFGTPIKWLSSGGDFTTAWNSVATGNAVGGPKGNLGATRSILWQVYVAIKTGTTPTINTFVEVYWCPSNHATAGTDNAGKSGLITGVDQDLTAPASILLASFSPIGVIGVDATSDTVYKRYFEFSPKAQYGSPVLVNRTGATWSTTASDFEFWMTPITLNTAA